jgi:hypothetical protein
MTHNGKGYIADPVGHQRTPLRAVAHRLGASASSADLSTFTTAVMDQNGSSGCVGHGDAGCIFTAFGAIGQPLPWVPSPLDIYTGARCIDLVDPSMPIADTGSQPNAAARWVNEWGIRPIRPLPGRFSDCDPATINDRPKFGDLVTDSLAIVVGQYAIYSATDAVLALSNRIPFTFAIEADTDAFQNYATGMLGPQGTGLDHYVFCFGFETLSSGARAFHCRNSWGTSWGDRGNFVLSEDGLNQCGDMIAWKVRLA